MDSEEKECPLCGVPAPRESVPGYCNVELWKCQRCGDFVADQIHLAMYSDWLKSDPERRPRLSALARELSFEFGKPVLIVPDSLPESTREHGLKALPGTYPVTLEELLSRWPRSVPDRLDRALLNLSRLPDAMSRELDPDSDPTWFLAISERDSRAVAELLVDLGHVTRRSRNPNSRNIRLSAKGWERVAELTTTRSSRRSPAFVAMWFDEQVQSAYEDAIGPAVREAGYKVTRVDLEEHNEYIMDEVLRMIRVAPFVVAELTGNRNGVYYEAGYAKGRGIPVIHCCREDHADKAHFDVQQINQIRWTGTEELKERLKNRVLATVGQGPYPPPPEAERPVYDSPGAAEDAR